MSRTPSYAFDQPPAIGHAIMVPFAGKRQRYSVVAVDPWTRRDGTASFIITWASKCATCGFPFRLQAGLRGYIDTRRCPECIRKRQQRAFQSRRVRPSTWRG